MNDYNRQTNIKSLLDNIVCNLYSYLYSDNEIMRKKFFIAFALTLFLLLPRLSPKVYAEWKLIKNGNMVFIKPQVLGDEDKKNEVKKEEKHEKNNQSKPPEIKKDEIKEIKVGSSDDKKSLKLEIEEKNGKKHEEEQDEFEVETENEPIKISTGEAENEFDIKRGTGEAKLHFPLSVNPETHALTVTTPQGAKTVTILPDTAAHTINELGAFDNASQEAKFELQMENNQLVYKVEGKKQKKLLGLLPVSLLKEVILSAETGNVIKINESFFTRLFDFLSI